MMLATILLLCALAALLAFWRLFAGPTRTDRVVALDLLFAIATVLALTAAWASGRSLFVDVAIGLALVGFVGSLAWARLIRGLAKQSRRS